METVGNALLHRDIYRGISPKQIGEWIGDKKSFQTPFEDLSKEFFSNFLSTQENLSTEKSLKLLSRLFLTVCSHRHLFVAFENGGGPATPFEGLLPLDNSSLRETNYSEMMESLGILLSKREVSTLRGQRETRKKIKTTYLRLGWKLLEMLFYTGIYIEEFPQNKSVNE